MGIIYLVLVSVIGLVIGSFLNVVIYRLPRGESVAYPPSHCQHCHKQLTPLELIPLFSYLFLKGRCKGCGVKISPRYPFIETLNALFYVIVFYINGMGLDLDTLFAFGLVSLLIVVTFIDLDHLLIPDNITASIFVWVVSHSLLQLVLNPSNLSELFSNIYGLILGGGSFLLIAIVTKGAMGGGDIKLMGALGYYFGFTHTLGLIFFSFVIGGVLSIVLVLFHLKKRKDMIPFGPFISLAAIVMMTFGDTIIDWYINLL
ncbi:type 4 prepilin-like proteins leader peptide-processing enzyme [Halolactibacillus alkaliphilus]|uniref:Prepilin leader peptidase/N-methyltransferase n=1 Tax=Halolactibacillus alkaliphilus TaxID=442899 RepID=A0A511WZA6_9BACI|nr:A24 family peptidase [Halolactibacillus alkaliphilus]GEN55992.1 type 4 prepilin-like proteins leader peptide-processing enzyme [Halolactibacillus alkaliphilus]GGN68217.1 type 4 prepilin-like proteins leader peptide-processing enzyme [Halolactibacillus alkaliphilus]SFO69473.1 leader peptidase (prepilin peptidase) / N-methyltransferase [Halolactibacillus alkaliphilus]